MRLANKIAIITATGLGTGRASAILFAKEGAKVIVTDIDDADGEETVAAVTSSGGEAIFVHADVSEASEAARLIKVTHDRFGRIDILLNTAGYLQERASVETLDESLWDRVYKVNVKSIFLTAKYVVPLMKRAGGGVIINVASVAGIRPRSYFSAYASSKAAAIHLTKALALELAPDNIRVNCINPVAIDLPRIIQTFQKGADSGEGRETLINTIPLRRMCTPEDIAYAAIYLASDESAMLTGTCLDVDGGRGI